MEVASVIELKSSMLEGISEVFFSSSAHILQSFRERGKSTLGTFSKTPNKIMTLETFSFHITSF